MLKNLKKIWLILLLLFSFVINSNTFADKNDEIINNNVEKNNENLSFSDYITNYRIAYKKHFLVWEEAQIDLTAFSDDLKNTFPDDEFIFEWNNGSDIINWAFFKNIYEKIWTKWIWLSIYKKEWQNKNLVFSKNFEIFAYEKIIPILVSKQIKKDTLDNFVDSYKPFGIYLEVLWYLWKSDLEVYSVLNNFDKCRQQKWDKSDFLMIWWDRDFSFDILSKINREITLSNRQEILNIFIMSDFNIDILSPYLWNFLANKNWINKLIIMPENSRFQITSNEINLEKIIEKLDKSMLAYRNVELKTTWISDFLFISKFVNIFSNKWFDTDSIYVILLIPFMLAFISFFKHLVWLSTMWIIPPMFLMILAIKLWFLISFWFFVWLVILNLIILKFSGRFNMLYTPKVSILISSNLILFIIILWLLIDSKLLALNITDSLYLLLFVVVSERVLSVIVSKEFSSYRRALLNTLIVPIAWYLLFSIPAIKTFILAYPEIMIIMLPVLFMIWRFTWLRITEYFRFREVIKTIEEEE